MTQVLVVEDDKDVSAALGLLLERSGHAVRVVGDGRAALRSVHQLKPDLVVLDVELPGLTGDEQAAEPASRLASPAAAPTRRAISMICTALRSSRGSVGEARLTG